MAKAFKIVSVDAQFLNVEWDIDGVKTTEKLDARHYPTSDAVELEKKLNKQLEAFVAGKAIEAKITAVAPEVKAMEGVKKTMVEVTDNE